MQKEILLEMVNQNLKTCSYALDRVTEENKDFRLLLPARKNHKIQ